MILICDDVFGQMLFQFIWQGKIIYEDVNMCVIVELFDLFVFEMGDEWILIGYGFLIDYESVQDIGDGFSIGFKVDCSIFCDFMIIKCDNDVLGLLD